MSKQALMIAQHKVETTHIQSKREAERCKLNLLTQRKLFQGSITGFKKDIRNLHGSEENGLSLQKMLLIIEESYDKLSVELTQLVNEWYRFIRLTVTSKEPQPQSSADREILK